MEDRRVPRTLPAPETVQVLIEHEKENNAFIRHYEDVRFKISQINVTLSVLLVGASRFPGLRPSRIYLSVFLVVLGLHGVLVCLKYTERADRHAAISRSYRKALSDFLGAFGPTSMEDIHRRASESHKRGPLLTRIFVRIRARVFWIAIHVAIVALGVLLAFT